MDSFFEDSFELREIPQTINSNRRMVKRFLEKFNLTYDLLDTYVGIYVGDEMVAGGGYYSATIKCIAIDAKYREYGLSNIIVSYLCSELWSKGFSNIFIFTKPINEKIFKSIGFTTIGNTSAAILLENKKHGIDYFCQQIATKRQLGVQGAIVMNANPFTLGHLYLIEEAIKKCDHLHVFVVEEEKSEFPFAVRKHLVESSVANFSQVTVHAGGSYIISAATFPTYFIKELSDIAVTYAKLDIDLFVKYIAPALGISKRFMGEEPLDKLTHVYNQVMKSVLPLHHIQPIVIYRKEVNGTPISASQVRNYLRQNNLQEAIRLVPASTKRYLLSKEAKSILEKICCKSNKGEQSC